MLASRNASDTVCNKKSTQLVQKINTAQWLSLLTGVYVEIALHNQPRPQGAFPWLWRWGALGTRLSAQRNKQQ